MSDPRRGDAKRRLGRLLLAAALILTASALAKWVVFDTVLAPDGTGRQPVETGSGTASAPSPARS